MATPTAFFNLIKPAGTDNVDVTVLNENFDKIDAQMQLNKENIEKDVIGATDINNGIAGRVPAPPAGYDGAYLSGSGTWRKGHTHHSLGVSALSTITLAELGIIDEVSKIKLITLRTDVADAQAASVYLVRYAEESYSVTPILEGISDDAPIITAEGVIKLSVNETEQTVYVLATEMLSIESVVTDTTGEEE